MADYTGTLPTIAVAPLLWALPLVPLGGALMAARLSRLDEEPEAGGAWVAPVSTWLALLASLPLAYRLGGLGGASRALVAPGPVLARVGSLDLHLGLTLDATSALALGVLLVAASVVQLALLLVPPSRGQGTAAALAACTAAASLSILAACPLVASVGAGVLSVLGAVACGALGPSARAPRLAAGGWLGDLVLLAGGAVVTWGLAGAWTSDGLVPAGRPQFVAVVRGEPRGPGGPAASAQLTMTSSPGSQVRLDGDDRNPLEAPFARRSIVAGPHALQIDPGSGADASEIRKFRIPEGTEAVVVRTSSATEAAAATALVSLRQEKEPLVERGRLASERWAGVPVGGVAAVLVLGGLLLRLSPPAGRDEDEPQQALLLLLPQVASVVLVGVLGVRWLPLLALELGWPWWLPLGAVAGALVLALAGLRQSQPGRALGYGAGASAALGLGAMAAGDAAAGALQVMLVGAATALALWTMATVERAAAHWSLHDVQGTAVADEHAVRWLKVAYALLVGLLPLGFGLLEVLRAVGGAAGLAVVVTVVFIAAAVGRVVYAMTEGTEAPTRAPRNLRQNEGGERRRKDLATSATLPSQVAPVLGVLAIALGPLGATTLYGAPLGTWLASTLAAPFDARPASVMTFLSLVLVTVAALAGARWSRRRHGADRSAEWTGEEPLLRPPASAVGWLRATLGVLGSAVGAVSRRMEDLLAGAPRGGAS